MCVRGGGVVVVGAAVGVRMALGGLCVRLTGCGGGMEELWLSGTDWGLVFIFVVCVVLLKKGRMNPVLVMVLAGVAKTGLALAGF